MKYTKILYISKIEFILNKGSFTKIKALALFLRIELYFVKLFNYTSEK